MQLYPVHSGVFRPLGCLVERSDQGLYFRDRQGTMRRDRNPAVFGDGQPFERNYGRCHGRFTIAEIDMRLTAVMGHLHDDLATLGMDRVRNTSPTRDMGLGVDARCALIAAAVEGRMRAFRDQQAAF